MTPDLALLQRALGYTFSDVAKLRLALTHRSASHKNNERLEFLGDALLSMVIAEALFEKYPKHKEGDLTRLRANLVREQTLADIAKSLCLGDYVTLGLGELKSGGHQRDSILADCVEAIFAAVYLDAGTDAVKACILHLYEKKLEEEFIQPQKDPKTILQERLQADAKPLPLYDVERVEGKGHELVFYMRCTVPSEQIITFGEGSSRRAAEQQAAQTALEKMNER